jgi:hypothetical protein
MTKFFQFHEPGLRPIRVHYSQTPFIPRREFGLRVPAAFGYGTLELVWTIEEYLHTLSEVDLRVDVVFGKRAPGLITVLEGMEISLNHDAYPLAIALNFYPADAVPDFPTAERPAGVGSVTRTVVVDPTNVFFEAPGRKRHRISSWDELGSYVGETVEEWK